MKNEDFEDVYQKYHKFSVRNARKIVKDRMAAEDISQDVFFRLYEIRETLDLSCEKMLRSLIFMATVNKAKDYLKKPGNKFECSGLDELEYAEPYGKHLDPEEIIIHKEDVEFRNRVLISLREKNPMNYDILIKVACFEIPPEAVAEEYEITRNNVNNRILRTRKWMRKELNKLRE